MKYWLTTLFLYASFSYMIVANINFPNESLGDIKNNTTLAPGNLLIQKTNTVIINEVDADTPGSDSQEFIELYDGGVGNVSLNGLVLVTFNGSDNKSYNLGGHSSGIDLDGYSTNANGYFVIGNPGVPNVNLTFNKNSLQNGADAIAIYMGNGADFLNDTPLSTTNLIDAIVYDTNDADNKTLLTLLNTGQPQVNEGSGGNKDIHSIQRLPNGEGEARNTIAYFAEIPTPGAINTGTPEIIIEGNSNIISIGDTTPAVDDHTVFPDTLINGGTSSRTYKIINNGLGELNISGFSIGGVNSADFTFKSPLPATVGTGSNESFTVIFNPSAAGLREAIVSIQTNDTGKNPYIFNIQGIGVDISAPSLQASNILLSKVNPAKIIIQWARGNGDSCAVFIHRGQAGNANPDNTYYKANKIFGSGAQIGTSGWFCIYNGEGNTTEAGGLIPGGEYQIIVCEYNEDSGFIRYNTDSTSGNNVIQKTSGIIINEIDADNAGTDYNEFIELYDGGAGGVSLDYLAIVLFNGSNDKSYATYGLDGQHTNADGYFVLGSPDIPSSDMNFKSVKNQLQNGADAIALYMADISTFPKGSAVTTNNLIDAIVYDTDDADDASLMLLLNAGQPQVNENGQGGKDKHSLQRIPNGQGGYKNTLTYQQQPPTPGKENFAYPVIASARYNFTTGMLTVSGANFIKKEGAANDINVSKLSITGEGGTNEEIQLTTTNVEITSDSVFMVLLNEADKNKANQILNNNGTESTGGNIYNLAGAEDWAAGADTAKIIAGPGPNPIIVSNVLKPEVISASYDALTGELIVAGLNFVKKTGDANDIQISSIKIYGGNNQAYELQDNSYSEITSSTKFSFFINPNDKTNIDALWDKKGAVSEEGTIYRIDFAEGWLKGAMPTFGIEDNNNPVTALNVNSKPTGANCQVYSFSNETYTFSGSDFIFNDADGDDFAGISIEKTGSAGNLKYNGSEVLTGMVCPNISLLKFTPAQGQSGKPYASFEFKLIDSKGGISKDTYTMSINITGVNISVSDVLCYNGNSGSIMVKINNGSPNFTYNWSTGKNITSPLDTDTINGLAAGTYTLSFIDGSGISKVINTEVKQPGELQARLIRKYNVLCYDDKYGLLNIEATGGTAPYEVLWSNKKTSFKVDKLYAGTYEALVTDVNGCEANFSETIHITDNVPPTAICKDTVLELDNNGIAMVYPRDICGGSYDNCKISSWSIYNSYFICNDVGLHQASAYVTDNNGNISECSSAITVVDNSPPEFICKDVIAYFGQTGNSTVMCQNIIQSVNDNCGIYAIEPEQFNYNYTDILSSGANTINPWINELHYDNTGGDIGEFVEIAGIAGNTIDGYKLIFYNGNNGQVYKSVELEGVIPDEGEGFGATIFEISGIQNGPADGLALVSADLDVIEFISYEGQLTAIEGFAAGHISIDIAAEENGATQPGASLQKTGNDIWEATTTASPGLLNPGQVLPVPGAIIETITVTDVNGNSNTCKTNITVIDSMPPVAICNNLNIELDKNGIAVITAAMVDGRSWDNCGIKSLEISNEIFNCSNIGENTVTLTVTDHSGNEAECNAVITVSDNTPPELTCNDVVAHLDENGQATINAGLLNAGSTDNCGVESLNISHSIFTCNDAGENEVILSASDHSGNISSCTAVVVIDDMLLPNAFCNNFDIFLNRNGSALINASMLDNGSWDNCRALPFEISKHEFNCSHLGAGTVTLTVTDIYNNTQSCESVVAVYDTLAPEPACKDISIFLDSNGFAELTSKMVDNGSIDNCGEVILSLNKTLFDCTDIGENIVTLTVSDKSKNKSTCKAMVYVVDTIPPLFTPVDNIIANAQPGACSTEINYPGIKASDNCYFEVIQTSGLGEGSLFPIGATSEVFIATDSEGNTDTLSFNVVVNEVNANPTLANIQNFIIEEDSVLIVNLTGISDGGSCVAQDLKISAKANNNEGIDDIKVNYQQGSNTATLIVKFTSGWIGLKTIIVEVEDSLGGKTEREFIIQVLKRNNPPIVINPVADIEIYEVEILNIPLTGQAGHIFYDPDNDLLDISFTINGASELPPFITYVHDTLIISPVIGDSKLLEIIITATDPEGASASDTFNINIKKVLLSDNNEKMLHSAKLYPNPTNGLITFDIKTNQVIFTSEVEIYTSKGKLVTKGEYGKPPLLINAKNLADGLYYLRFKSGEVEVVKQFIIKQ